MSLGTTKNAFCRCGGHRKHPRLGRRTGSPASLCRYPYRKKRLGVFGQMRIMGLSLLLFSPENDNQAGGWLDTVPRQKLLADNQSDTTRANIPRPARQMWADARCRARGSDPLPRQGPAEPRPCSLAECTIITHIVRSIVPDRPLTLSVDRAARRRAAQASFQRFPRDMTARPRRS